MHQLGFVSAILADNSFEEVVDFAAENQFSCVEMMCWPKGKAERRYAGVTHVNVDELDDSQVKHIKGYLDEKGVYISGLGYYPNPLAADKEKTEKEIRGSHTFTSLSLPPYAYFPPSGAMAKQCTLLFVRLDSLSSPVSTSHARTV